MTTASLPTSFVYESCDVPEGQTLDEWRRARSRRDAPRRRRMWLRLLRSRG
jgi:hypothetical protein